VRACKAGLVQVLSYWFPGTRIDHWEMCVSGTFTVQVEHIMP
jgi:hypothetical protein